MGILDSVLGKATNKASRGIESVETKEADSSSTETTPAIPNTVLVYPANLGAEGGHPNFFMFRAYDLNSSTKAVYTDMRKNYTDPKGASPLSQELRATIALYAPNLVEEVSHEFDKTPTSAWKDFLGAAARTAGAATNGDLEGAKTGAKQAVSGLVGGTIAQMQRSAIQSTAAVRLATHSQVVTDNVTVSAYKGTTQRQQTLVYLFHPKSLDELKSVGNIIKTFYGLSLSIKQSMSSDIVQILGNHDVSAGFSKFATVLKTPPVWFIEEVSDTSSQRYTPRFLFGPAGITSVKLNKTPEQYWRTFKGTAGDPAGIEMEITFTELIPLDRAMYERDLNSSWKGYDPLEMNGEDKTSSGSLFGDIL